VEENVLASHSFEEHRGELELRIDAPTLPSLFAEAGRALVEAMDATPLADAAGCDDEVVVNAQDREALLVEWLNELVFRSEVAKALFTEFEITHLSDRQLVAVIRGTRVERLRNPVKAATYHDLSITERVGGLTAKVILDV
jgi:protein archease